MTKPRVVVLGTTIIERDGPGFLVLLPDGNIRPFADYAKAVKAIGKWQATHTPADAIGVMAITSYDGSIQTMTSKNGRVTA